MSDYEEQTDHADIICPYCKERFQEESEDYSEDQSIEECGDCGKKYWKRQSFSVTCYASPDCELNDQDHKWEDRPLGNGKTYKFCSVCGQCK